MHKPTGFVAAAAAVLLVACADIQDDAVDRGVDSPPAMETTPGADQWQDTLQHTVPPAPGVEEPGAGEPRTPAAPPGTAPQTPGTAPQTPGAAPQSPGTGTGGPALRNSGPGVRVA